MPAAGTTQHVRCMHDADGDMGGGVATVHWLADVAPEKLAATAESILASQKVQPHTSVFVTGAAGRYVAESYSPAGARIQFCGHGALAAAWVALNEHEPAAQTVAFSNKQRSWQALRPESSDTDIALVYPRPTPVDCAVPEFAAACLGSEPAAAAEVGTATDYLILELDNAQAVQHLQPDFSLIIAATQRALIVTAPSTINEQPGCVFRYFAPQYGDPEDAATGSAAVQLAAYWSPRLEVEQFSARQLSLRGAWMQLRRLGHRVELAARVGYG